MLATVEDFCEDLSGNSFSGMAGSRCTNHDCVRALRGTRSRSFSVSASFGLGEAS